MDLIRVKDLMVPLDEYATVSEDATLYDAVTALEEAQERLDRTMHKYLHRAVLVLDGDKNVVGKISQLDVLKALEPRYKGIGDTSSLSRAGFSPEFLKSMMEHQKLWTTSLIDICSKAARINVRNFMHTPTEGEYIDEDAPLEEAMHMLVMGNHHSLLVAGEGRITGILKLTDVFAAIYDLIRKCPI
ncbi:MAG: CBS domain-containing protein [Deltaproteobacteria bacterium]|nr:CBS domain-containing protein [Deltaproteobacteria bacterium]MBW2048862.1 CBS domain-containing protein [Deltaproteobacteria bacterium]MBW2110131.1 CBS domain-containing protein [Deltaproteobacteria bacterium]MBW2352585.1 CBS domain-containing protein [Deltaproteobacteria bacterium]HDZ90324.1 CBS domain-containing protein [Deltaproteobacteria bacterium]